MSKPLDEMKTKTVPELPHPASAFIPHSQTMCVIDTLLSVVDKTSEASVKIRPDSIFLRDDGTLDEAVLIEMIAQTIAAGTGYERFTEESKNEGYLLGIRNMKISGTARAGDELHIKAFKYLQYENFGVIEGTVRRGEEVLAQGEIKVIQLG